MNNLKNIPRPDKMKKDIELMTHVVVGYPDLPSTIQIVKTMVSQGVKHIELQIPFSDPLADGPTIMRACEQSLLNGTRVSDSFSIASSLSNNVSVPLYFMAYYNTVFCYGVKKFCQDAANAGISGLIVPDMPIDEENQEHLIKFSEVFGLSRIPVISPVSTSDRLRKNAMEINAFVYCTARQGITGTQDRLSEDIHTYLNRVREVFSCPRAVGFGIAKKEHIDLLRGYADIAVVGSAIIKVIEMSQKKDLEKNVARFIQSLIV